MQPNPPPMVDYTVKLMLLEAVRCYQTGNPIALQWLERKMFEFSSRIQELNKR